MSASKSIISYDKDLPEIPDRRPWEKPASFLVRPRMKRLKIGASESPRRLGSNGGFVASTKAVAEKDGEEARPYATVPQPVKSPILNPFEQLALDANLDGKCS